MSFWFCQNAILSIECRRKAFLTNNVLERILLVCQTLQVSTVHITASPAILNNQEFILKIN